MDFSGILIGFALVATLILGCGSIQALADAIQNLSDQFRGGPPTPMHPSPAADVMLLRRRRAPVR